ncbi:uncharacterized protein [Chamaea fasciata]|uniref:uncharacterized protein isoform X2 n=1 Tax=Chamaea fasciata TaxID=190680 RepID=UPI00336A6B7A
MFEKPIIQYAFLTPRVSPECPQGVPRVSPAVMDACEVLEGLVAVVAKLGELAATVTVPRDTWPFVCPKSLHASLREFIWILRCTLEHSDVTSQAVAALVTIPGATWDDVRAAAGDWRDSRFLFTSCLMGLLDEANALLSTLEDGDTTEATAPQAGDLQDEITGWGTVKNMLAAATQQPLMALVNEEFSSFLVSHTTWAVVAFKVIKASSQVWAAARRGQRAKVAQVLLGRLLVECSRASMYVCMLRRQLQDVELALKKKEAPADAREDLVAAVVKVKWLWEGSTRLAMHHLMGTLGDIHNLLLSPYGGSGGPVCPGGPGGSSMARRRQEAIEDILRPRQEKCRAPSWGETSNGSSTTGTPEQPEDTWGKPEPGAVCETAGRLPKHPDVLPPGTRCELATSKSVLFIKDSCRECIPVEVTGISTQRQDFLIVGKDSNSTLGLSVLPTLISANCNEELKVLALAHKAPVVIEPKTPIAVAIALPMNRNERAGYRELPCDGFTPAPNDRWVKQITKEQPELECSLTHMESGETVQITGMLDTGADVTAISHGHWPSDWNLGPPECLLTGFGGATECKQSKSEITVTGPEGKTADIRPYVVWDNSTVWGRDVMFQWRAKMELDS